MKKQFSSIRICEISTYATLTIIALFSFFMCLFKLSIPLYICSTLNIVLIIYLLIHFYLHYDVSFLGIVLVIFGIFIVLTQVIFFFAYNNIIWAQKFLWISYYAMLEILSFIFTSLVSSSAGVFTDVYILNACVSFTLFIFLFFYNWHIKNILDEENDFDNDLSEDNSGETTEIVDIEDKTDGENLTEDTSDENNLVEDID